MIPAVCPKCGARTKGGLRAKTVQVGPNAPGSDSNPMAERAQKGLMRAFPGIPMNRAAQAIKPILPANPIQSIVPQPPQAGVQNVVPPAIQPNLADVMVDPELVDHETNMDHNHHRNVANSADALGL